MADQATGTVETSGGAAAAAVSPAHGAGPAHLEHNPGRPISWVGTSIVIVGSIVGGVAFVPHPTWWLLWVGVAIAVVGILVLAAARTVSTDWY
ncbi:MAG TPA: HGxxPAAW family protein [Trebonia sp.]|nr:HGxxPAAW family protein [Trebonia sp.]